MTIYQLAAAAAAGLSAAVAAVVTAGDDALVAALLIGLAVAIVTCGAFTWIESWLSHVLAYRVIAALRLRVYDATPPCTRCLGSPSSATILTP